MDDLSVVTTLQYRRPVAWYNPFPLLTFDLLTEGIFLSLRKDFLRSFAVKQIPREVACIEYAPASESNPSLRSYHLAARLYDKHRFFEATALLALPDRLHCADGSITLDVRLRNVLAWNHSFRYRIAMYADKYGFEPTKMPFSAVLVDELDKNSGLQKKLA